MAKATFLIDIHRAEAKLKVQVEKLALLEDDIAEHTILAPFDGYVTEQYTEVGQWVAKVSVDDAEQRLELFQEILKVRRKIAFANPLLNFDTILFVKRAPPMFPHMSDQFYGWWSRPGGSICLLTGFKSGEAKVQCITKNWDDGSFIRPDLSHDGRKVLFAYCRLR